MSHVLVCSVLCQSAPASIPTLGYQRFRGVPLSSPHPWVKGSGHSAPSNRYGSILYATPQGYARKRSVVQSKLARAWI